VLWSGGVTDTSARVHVRPPNPNTTVRLVVDTAQTWTTASRHAGSHPQSSPEITHFHLQDLTPETTYHYALEVDGRIDTTRTGRFRTFSRAPFSFRVALGACAETGSRSPVFDAIRQTNPDLFLHLGDLHYEDITSARPEPFKSAYRRVHRSPAQAALFRSVPLAYMWDDHDYGPNNSSREAPGQNTARRVYREYVPHYGTQNGTGPIYQAFTAGRVRFLLTDLRSARTPPEAPDSVKTMMGTEQKTWFKRQLAQARHQYPVIVWVSSVPWIAAEGTSEDHWGAFPEERHELATYIDSIGVADQMVVLAGDAHMVALDDGTHNEYGYENGGGFPVIHAAALDRPGSVKGGPYTHGPYPSPQVSLWGERDGQFVQMDVRDPGGDEVCVTWTGKRYKTRTDQTVDLLEWQKCFSVP